MEVGFVRTARTRAQRKTLILAVRAVVELAGNRTGLEEASRPVKLNGPFERSA